MSVDWNVDDHTIFLKNVKISKLYINPYRKKKVFNEYYDDATHSFVVSVWHTGNIPKSSLVFKIL